jgi:two-component system cell cycle response regulator DivK
VEDNPANIATMQLILERQGATVWFDRWGDLMLQRLQAFAPVDLILLDLMFPNNVTGYAVFDQIRQLEGFNKIPVVAVSASDPAESIPRTQAKGFAGYIAKPVDFDNFPEQLKAILNGDEDIWIR